MQHWKPKFFLPLFCSLAILSACSYRHNKSNPSDATSLTPSAELLRTVSYAQVAQEIFNPKCVICHGNSGGINLESYGAARASLERINIRALVEKTMPKTPVAPLTPEEQMLLAAWIQAGGPEFPSGQGSNQTPVAPSPPALEANFASIQANILNKKCILCHFPEGKAKSLPFQTIEEMGAVLIPGDPANSDLYNALFPDADLPMPPPTSGIARLQPEEIEIIKQWIANGAKD